MQSAMWGNAPGQTRSDHAGGLLLSLGGRLRDLEYDQFLRYSGVALQLDRMLGPRRGRKLRILEVGSNVLNLLPEFLDSQRVDVVRCDVIRPLDQEDQFVLIEKNEPLPFGDGAFDAVVALEVLEHIPPAERARFLAECVRVAAEGAIFTCPNGVPEVELCEEVAGQAYAARHDAPHPFLVEHQQFGLPCPAEVRAVLDGLGHAHAMFANAPLNAWLIMLLLSENMTERRVPLTIQVALRRIVQDLACGSPSIPYRRVYVVAKTARAEAALESAVPGPFLSPVQEGGATSDTPASWRAKVLDIAQQLRSSDQWRLLRTLGLLQAEFLRACQTLDAAATAGRNVGGLDSLRMHLAAACEELRGLRAEVWSACLAQSRSVWGGEDEALDLRNVVAHWCLRTGQRASRWARRAWVAAVPQRHADNEWLPLAQLAASREPGQWTVLGQHAQFVFPRELMGRVLRLRLKLRTARAGRIELAIDGGTRFESPQKAPLGHVNGWGTLDHWVVLDVPGRALRLDLIDVAGPLEIECFEVQQPAAWGVLWHGLHQRLRNGFGFRTVASLAKGAARTLWQSGWRGVWAKLSKSASPAVAPSTPASRYQSWRDRHRIAPEEAQRLRTQLASLPRPGVSLLVPCTGTASMLQATVQSVINQLDPQWQLCLAVASDTPPELIELARKYVVQDARICMEWSSSTGAADLANSALNQASRDYVALLPAGDELADHAVAAMGTRLHDAPDLDWLYSDEDRLDAVAGYAEPFFKPDWSPEYLLACFYTGHLSVYRTSLVRDCGGWRTCCEGAHEYDLALRVSLRTERVGHLADVLYHNRGTLPVVAIQAEAAQMAIQAHLQSRGAVARVEPGEAPGAHRVRFALAGEPRVSIVIPTACGMGTFRHERTWFLWKCVESIYRRTAYKNFEVIALDNNDMPAELEQRITTWGVRRVPFLQPFNLATKMNCGAAAATGEQLVFMNDDIEVLTPDWISALLEYAQQPGIGAVGPKLLFPDERLQHVGVTILEGNPGHPYYRFPREHPGYFLGNVVPRNYSAVTGACVMTRAALFRELGGFDSAFPLNYNDVDYCLRVRAAGQRIVYTPHATLYHHESVSKSGTHEHENIKFKQKWLGALPLDPYYNPNLAMDANDYSIGLHAA